MGTSPGYSLHKWTDQERGYIRANYASITDAEMSRNLTVACGEEITVNMVRAVRHNMKLRKKRGRGICAMEDPDKYIPNPRPGR